MEGRPDPRGPQRLVEARLEGKDPLNRAWRAEDEDEAPALELQPRSPPAPAEEHEGPIFRAAHVRLGALEVDVCPVSARSACLPRAPWSVPSAPARTDAARRGLCRRRAGVCTFIPSSEARALVIPPAGVSDRSHRARSPSVRCASLIAQVITAASASLVAIQRCRREGLLWPGRSARRRHPAGVVAAGADWPAPRSRRARGHRSARPAAARRAGLSTRSARRTRGVAAVVVRHVEVTRPPSGNWPARRGRAGSSHGAPPVALHRRPYFAQVIAADALCRPHSPSAAGAQPQRAGPLSLLCCLTTLGGQRLRSSRTAPDAPVELCAPASSQLYAKRKEPASEPFPVMVTPPLRARPAWRAHPRELAEGR